MRMYLNLAAPAVALALLIGLVGCDSVSSIDQTDSQIADNARPANANVNAQLAAARAATAIFQRVDVAEAAGYIGEGEPCVYHGVLGGMGIHYVNGSLMGPPEALDVTKPQALLYEPQSNGRMRLVGVEYIVPYDIHPLDAGAPTLFGQHFHPGPPYVGWALHVYNWRNNPLGMFEDFNPKVTCDYADFSIDVTNPPPPPAD